MWEGENSLEQGSGAVVVINLLTLEALSKDHPHLGKQMPSLGNTAVVGAEAAEMQKTTERLHTHKHT